MTLNINYVDKREAFAQLGFVPRIFHEGRRLELWDSSEVRSSRMYMNKKLIKLLYIKIKTWMFKGFCVANSQTRREIKLALKHR